MVGFQKKSFVCIALTLVHFLPAAWSWQKKRTAQHQVNMALVGAEITVLQVLVLGNTSRLSPEVALCMDTPTRICMAAMGDD